MISFAGKTIYRTKFENTEYLSELISYVKDNFEFNREHIAIRGNMSSTFSFFEDSENIIGYPKFSEISNFLVSSIRKLTGFVTEPELSWINISNEQGNIAPHSHGDCVVAVVYLHADSSTGNLFFLDPTSKETLEVPVQTGDVIIFPGQLIHYTEPNTSQSERAILSVDFQLSEITTHERLFDMIYADLQAKDSQEKNCQLQKNALLQSLDIFVDSFVNNNQSKKVFGLGTGRCGTSSLAEILNQSPNSFSTSEHQPWVRWYNDIANVDFHLSRMNKLSKVYNYVIDISQWWLPYVEYIISRDPNSYFIVLKRDKESTVNSFVRTFGNTDLFKEHAEDPRAHCLPYYDSNSIKENSSLYWDEYYNIVDDLVEKYPDKFLIINTNSLSDIDTLKKIKIFLEYDIDLKPIPPKNRKSLKDSQFIKNPFTQIIDFYLGIPKNS